MMYRVFATVPVAVTKDSEGYSIVYSSISSTLYNGQIDISTGLISITESGDSATYERRSTRAQLTDSMSGDMTKIKQELAGVNALADEIIGTLNSQT